ncbi:MAG TPA: BA14K family protein [Aestuariivirgaceae bacterium]|nr:BA14K family protein [Aestuariivirgaceae bacterium]
MRWLCLSGSIAVFLTCTLASGAGALPLAGTGQAVAPLVQSVVHKPNEWYWHGHWWRPGPWSGHVIHGMVTRRGHDAIFVPWGADWLRYCAARHRSFDPATGTYFTRTGMRRVCR